MLTSGASLADRAPGGLHLNSWSQHSVIQRTLCLSLLLHAALLLVIRSGPFSMQPPGLAPEWHLRIADEGDHVAEHGVVEPARRAPVSPIDPTPEPLNDDTAPDLQPLASTSQADTHVQQPSPGVGDEAETVAKSAAPAAETEFADVLTTVSVQAQVVAPAYTGRPMTSAEREMMAGRIKGWSSRIRNPEQVPTSLTWRENNRQYTAEFVRHPATSATDLERVDVVVTTEENGRSLRSRLQLMRLAFSQFAQLVDQWDQQVQLHDDEIYGRFHSNSEILLGRDGGVMPRFFGQVTTTMGYRVVSGLERLFREQAFTGGLDTHAQHILMPRLSGRDTAGPTPPSAQRRQFDEDAQIVFYADGSYGWRGLKEPDMAERREQIGGDPIYLLAGRGVRLLVRGSVHGTVLVYSPTQIVVTGSLTYARRTADSTDSLGLVSDRDIVIADPKVTGPGNLEIDAAIYAHDRFRIDNIDSGGNALLSINGSLSAGTIGASEPRYATRIRYDRRFERVRPPDFPMTGRYELLDSAAPAQWNVADEPVRESP